MGVTLTDSTKDYLEVVSIEFQRKMRLINWEAGKWMQYTGYEYKEGRDVLVFNFKTSSYGISFSVEVKAFSCIKGEPFIPFNYTYNYFKSIKYSMDLT